MAEKMSAVQLFQFTEQLTSKSPTPGGGGVAALIGALAAALGAMATNLSIGKKKLLPFEEGLFAGQKRSRKRRNPSPGNPERLPRAAGNDAALR